VKPGPDWLTSGGSILMPCERSSEAYLKIFAVSSVTFVMTAA
jgi:hypothetical protein